MSNLFRRKQQKIYKKIDNIATKGRDSKNEFYKYVNELIDNGDYGDMEQVLYDHYEIDIIDATDIKSIKEDIWKKILFKTNSSFLKKLSSLYKSKKIYQNGYDILIEESYLDINNKPTNLIGKIIEIDMYTTNEKYYQRNINFLRIIGDGVYFLEVTDRNGLTKLFDENDEKLSFDQNLYNRYKKAIDFLLNI